MATHNDASQKTPPEPADEDRPIAQQDVRYDAAKRLLVTTCTKCGHQVHFALGPIRDAQTTKAAVLQFVEGYVGGACPPRNGAIAPDAHFELGYYGYWQVPRVLELIDQLQRDGILN